MADICTDNRFELIEKYKKELIESTNVESSPSEMWVLDNLLFRFWQIGWLDRLEQPERKIGKWIPNEDEDGEHYGDKCSQCGDWYVMPYGKTNYCPTCGSYNGGRDDEES